MNGITYSHEWRNGQRWITGEREGVTLTVNGLTTKRAKAEIAWFMMWSRL